MMLLLWPAMFGEATVTAPHGWCEMRPAVGYVVAVLTAWLCLVTCMFLTTGGIGNYDVSTGVILTAIVATMMLGAMAVGLILPFRAAYLIARKMQTTSLLFHLTVGVLIAILFGAWFSIGRNLEVIGERLVHLTYLQALLRFEPPFAVAGLAGSATYWVVSGRFGTHLRDADANRR
jgi:phosphate/sulfate permease